jgi:hypothetical protein
MARQMRARRRSALSRRSAVGKLGEWLRVVSNLGIIAGLLLVGFQMKQESDLAAAERVSGYFASYAASYGLAAGEDLPAAWARAQMNAQDLSDAGLSTIKYYLLGQSMLRIRGQALHDLELGHDLAADDCVRGWVNTPGNEAAQRWWISDHDRALAFAPVLRDDVDARLRELGPAQRSAHRRLLEQMRAGPLPGEARQPVQ